MLHKLRQYIAVNVRQPYKILVKGATSPELNKKIKTEYARSTLTQKDIKPSWFLDVLGIKGYSILEVRARNYLTLIEYYVNKKQHILMIAPKEYAIVTPQRYHSLAILYDNMLTDLTTSSHFSLSRFISDTGL